MDSKFWNNIYTNKSEKEVSWFQENPARSLELITSTEILLDANIIDIGGGDSRLVDHLINCGFNKISILDISKIALDKLKGRLKNNSEKITYIETDILNFKPKEKYQLWHDRAAFHFLTSREQVEKYLQIANEAIFPDGYLIISTFSDRKSVV